MKSMVSFHFDSTRKLEILRMTSAGTVLTQYSIDCIVPFVTEPIVPGWNATHSERVIRFTGQAIVSTRVKFN